MKDKQNNKMQHLYLILSATFFFLAAYIAVKCSITLFFKQHALSLENVLAIATSASCLYAISALGMGVLFANTLPSMRLSLFSCLFSALGIFLLSSPIASLSILGLSLFTVTSSLFLLNSNLSINALFDHTAERQKLNHIYQLVFNLGGLLGIIALSFVPLPNLNYLYSGCGMLLFLCSFLFLALKKQDSPFQVSEASLFKTSMIIIIATLFIYYLMNYPTLARLAVIFSFILSILAVCYLARKEQNKKYIQFIVLLLTCSAVYWISANILYSQFTLFLHEDVQNTLWGLPIPPFFTLLADPIGNLFFGWLIFQAYRKRTFSSETLLSSGLVFSTLAFLLLSFALYLTPSQSKISFLWPLTMVMIFSAGEFLILTTLTSLVNDLITHEKKRGFFLGLLRLVNAFGASLSFYLMKWSLKTGYETMPLHTHNIQLYLTLGLLSLLALLTFIFTTMVRK